MDEQTPYPNYFYLEKADRTRVRVSSSKFWATSQAKEIMMSFDMTWNEATELRWLLEQFGRDLERLLGLEE